MKTTVTAQDFIEAIHGDKNGFFHDYTAKAFDALISRIRQEEAEKTKMLIHYKQRCPHCCGLCEFVICH